MLIVLIIWIYLLALPSLYGEYIIKGIQAIFGINSAKQSGFELVWLIGIAALTVYATILSLFMKIELAAHLTGDYPQVSSSKGKGCKKTKDKVIAVVTTAAMPRKSQ